MDVFALQSSLTLNKKEYEKALSDAETQAKQFASKFDSIISSAMQNAGKSFSKGFDTSGFVNMTKVTTDYYNHIIKAAENASKAQINANAQVEKSALNYHATLEKANAQRESAAKKLEAAELNANAKIEAAKIASDAKLTIFHEQQAERQKNAAEKAAQAEIKAQEKAEQAKQKAAEKALNDEIKAAEKAMNAKLKALEKEKEAKAKAEEKTQKEAEKARLKALEEEKKAIQEEIKAKEKALAEKLKLIEKQKKEEEKAISDANKATLRVIAEVAKMEERHNAEIIQNTKSTWSTVTSVISKQIEITSKVFSVLGNAAKSGFSFVYETAKSAFSKVLEIGENAFSGLSDFASGSFEKITDVIGTATNALISFGKEAVSTGMEFEHSMSKVSSILETTTADLANVNVTADLSFGDFSGNLKELALTLGEHTKYTPDEVAQTVAVAVQNGMKEQELADFSELFLAAASAGDLDPATASNYIIKNKNALQLNAEQAREMTDMMAVASSNSGSTFGTLGQGMMKIGSLARNMKGGAAEEIEILALLSNAGENLTGTMGGNALRNIIKNLQNARSDAAAAAFEQMGFSAYDENDKMRPIPDIVADFRDYFKDKIDISNGENMEQDKLYSEIMNKIFTAYSITGMSALISTPEEKFTDLEERLANAEGAAVRMAEEREDNLQGDVTRFDSALLVAKTRIGDELTPSLRDFVQFATSQMGVLNDAIRENGITGGFEALSEAAENTFSKIVSDLPSVVNSIAKTSKAFVTGIRKNTKYFSNDFSKALTELVKLPPAIVPDMIDGGMQISIALMDGFSKAMPDIINHIPELISNVTDAVARNAGQFKSSGKELLESVFSGISQNKDKFKTAFDGFYNNVIVPSFDTVFVDIPDFITNHLSKLDLSGVGSVVGGLLERLDISGAVESGKNLFRTIFHKALEVVTQDTDSSTITQSIATLFTNGIENLSEIELDGEKIAHGINAVIEAVDFESLGGSLNTVINNFLDTTNDLLDNIDWESAGNGIGTVVNGIDFGGISHKLFTAFTKTIENSGNLLDGVASAIDAQTANSLISMAGTLAMGEAVLLAIAASIAKNTPAIILATGQLGFALAGAVKTALGSEVVLGTATAGGVGVGTAIGAGVVSAIAGWKLGTVIRESIIGSENMDNYYAEFIDGFKDFGYHLKAVWDWTFNNKTGLSYNQIYNNIALEETASGNGFQSDVYRNLVLNTGKEDIYEAYGNGNGMNFNAFEDSVKEKLDTIKWLMNDTANSDEIKTAGKNLADNFGEGIAESAKGAESMADIIKSVKKAAGIDVDAEGLNTEMKTSGENMTRMFADGISDNSGQVETSVNDMTQFIADNLAHHSPAKAGNLQNDDTWMPNMMQMFAAGIADNTYLVENKIISLTEKIQNRISGVVDSAFNWGWDMLVNFNNGIVEAYDSVVQTVANVASSIKSYLGFSEPEKGALSDFHTYAPDMMKLFAQGMKENQNLVQNQADALSENLADTFRNPFTIEFSETKMPELSLNADTNTFDKIRELLENPLVVSVQLSDGLEKLNSMFADVSLASPEMDAVQPYRNDYIRQIEDIKNTYSTTNYYSNIENNSYASSRNYENQSSANSVTVQNLTINIPGFNIESPSDMRRLAEALKEPMIEILDVQAVRDNRDLGGVGWVL